MFAYSVLCAIRFAYCGVFATLAQEVVAKWSEYVHARARDFFAGTEQLEEAREPPHVLSKGYIIIYKARHPIPPMFTFPKQEHTRNTFECLNVQIMDF